MKKFLSLFLCLTCILTLAACGKKAAPITLPQADKITSIDITIEENTVSHSDKTWMSEIIADISSSEPTKKEWLMLRNIAELSPAPQRRKSLKKRKNRTRKRQ